MSAPAGWKPADQVLASRVCAAAACGREFRPKRENDRFCSPRCEAIVADTDRAAEQEATPAETAAPQRPCEHCRTPFVPKQQGWQKKYCRWACVRAHGAVARKAPVDAATPAPEAEPEPEPEPGPEPAAPALEPVAADALKDGLRDGFAGGHLLGYDAGHADGFLSGAEAAAELAITLMRSPTIRALDPNVVRAIICEALS